MDWVTALNAGVSMMDSAGQSDMFATPDAPPSFATGASDGYASMNSPFVVGSNAEPKPAGGGLNLNSASMILAGVTLWNTLA